MATQREGSSHGEGDGPHGAGQDELPSYAEAVVGEGSTPEEPAAAGKGRPPADGAEEDEDEGGDRAEAEAEAGPSSTPPSYARLDPTARTYLLRPPFIYLCTGDGSASGAQVPAYQLAIRQLSSGRPSQLGIRRLRPKESRRLALVGPVEENALGHKGPTVRYDDYAGLYVIRSMRLFGSPEHEIEGASEGACGKTLPGHIRFEAPGRSYEGGYRRYNDSGRFWHMTRNEWRGNGYGCQPVEGLNRQLLFSVEKKGSLGGWRAPRSCEWRDRQGKLLAVEGRAGDGLELTGELLAGRPAEGAKGEARRLVMREALLTCWVGKAMASGSLKWNQW
ncbi:hypothetical protein VMCG_01746 [Cytospora schulzeri]|uniref:Uncharacterized protein n=1 Tax=Cytospora schulzeri TaxID=448051 RepID=A0A423X2S2_9PEZI|nr:hypothetical protein VMCG_01746 [Valsa malicola]